MATTNTNHDIKPQPGNMNGGSCHGESGELPTPTLSIVNGDDDELAPDALPGTAHVEVEVESFVRQRAFLAPSASTNSSVHSLSHSEVEAEAMLEEFDSFLQKMEDLEEKLRIQDAFVDQLQTYVLKLAEIQVFNEARLSSLEQNYRHLHVQIAYLEEIVDAMVKERRELGDGEQFARPLFVPTPFYY